jgi:hypothetical protein
MHYFYVSNWCRIVLLPMFVQLSSCSSGRALVVLRGTSSRSVCLACVSTIYCTIFNFSLISKPKHQPTICGTACNISGPTLQSKGTARNTLHPFRSSRPSYAKEWPSDAKRLRCASKTKKVRTATPSPATARWHTHQPAEVKTAMCVTAATTAVRDAGLAAERCVPTSDFRKGAALRKTIP